MNMIFPSAGIIHQMESEQQAASLLKLDWRSRIFCSFENKSDLYVTWKGSPANRVAFKVAYYEWLKSMMAEIDVLLLRYTPYDPLQYKFVRQSKVPVYLVMHTKYVEELAASRGLIPQVKAFAERIIGPASIRQATGVVAVTEEVGAHETGRSARSDGFILYPNGILCDETTEIPDRRTTDVPEIGFVASNFASWHGLDLLLQNLPLCDMPFRLHLVGTLAPDLLELAQHDSRCVIHGPLDSQEVTRVLSACWIGLSSLAHFRIGMKQACPLKTREYLSIGVPVYASYDEVFRDPMPFFHQGPVDLNAIVEFARSTRNYSRAEVAAAARPHIDKKLLLRQLASELISRRLHSDLRQA
jgi:hypothetical protein